MLLKCYFRQWLQKYALRRQGNLQNLKYQKAELTSIPRTRGLYYFYSGFIFSELVGPPVASVAADISPWLPFLINY